MIDLSALAGNGVGGAAQSQGKQGLSSSDLGQEDFLKLMVTQLQNQDPMKPMQSGEFLTQIAQFTSASGINEMQQSFSQFTQDMRGDQALRAAGLVGRQVVVESNQGYLPQDGALTGTVDVPANVGNLTVTIQDQAGQVVRQMNLGRQSAGETQFQWDGLNSDGQAMPAGTYTVSAQSQLGDTTQSFKTLTAAKVNSVRLGASGESPTLDLQGIGSVSLAAVSQVR